jgi:methionine-rich copper-binding protein CopC
LAVVCSFGGRGQAAPLTPLTEWKGEFFQMKQGGLYVKIEPKGFKASRQSKVLTSNIQVTIENILKRKAYVLSHKMAAVDGPPRELWKLPAGKYLVKSVVMVDTAGVKRVWRGEESGPNHKAFSVKRLMISNLGLWSVRPEGKAGLAVVFGMVPNSYVEAGDRTGSSVAAVINGFTGLVQEKFAGAKLFKAAGKDFAGKGEMRATVSFTRQIAMFYKLDLFKHNRYGKQISEVLAVYDSNLRNCYTSRLDYNDRLRGEVKFAFILSKQTGTMTKLKPAGGTANDPKLVECMYFELGQIQFPAPETMIGELTYTFDVR